jgi:hypothetical protein
MFFHGRPSARWIAITTILVLFAISMTAFLVGAWRTGGAHLTASAVVHVMAFGLGAAFLVSATVRFGYPDLPMRVTDKSGKQKQIQLKRSGVIVMFAIGLALYIGGTIGGIAAARAL